MTLEAEAEAGTNEAEAGEAAGEGGSGDNGQPGAETGAEGTGQQQSGDAAASENSGGEQVDIPESYRAEDGSADLNKLLERVKAVDEAESKRAETMGEVPDKPDAYDLSLPDDLKWPNGEPVKLSSDDEQLKGVLEKLHGLGLGQKAVSDLLGEYAKARVNDVKAQQQATEEQVQAEIAKLGDKAEERFKGLAGQLSETIGEKSGASLLDDIRTQEGFQALEALMEKLSGGGGRTPGGGAGRSEPKPLHERLWNTGQKGSR